MSTQPTSSGPSLARPVFATEDAQLIRKAILAYLENNKGVPDAAKYRHLYHRLGRFG